MASRRRSPRKRPESWTIATRSTSVSVIAWSPTRAATPESTARSAATGASSERVSVAINKLAGAWRLDMAGPPKKNGRTRRRVRPAGFHCCDWVQMLLMNDWHAAICGAVSGDFETIGLLPPVPPRAVRAFDGVVHEIQANGRSPIQSALVIRSPPAEQKVTERFASAANCCTWPHPAAQGQRHGGACPVRRRKLL